MHHFKNTAKCLGVAVLAFGLGLLVSLFLPEGFLVVIEALVIVSMGCLYFWIK